MIDKVLNILMLFIGAISIGCGVFGLWVSPEKLLFELLAAFSLALVVFGVMLIWWRFRGTQILRQIIRGKTLSRN